MPTYKILGKTYLVLPKKDAYKFIKNTISIKHTFFQQFPRRSKGIVSTLCFALKELKLNEI
jgi:hypothetical protein